MSAVRASFLSRQIALLRELLLGWQSHLSLRLYSPLSPSFSLSSHVSIQCKPFAPNKSRAVPNTSGSDERTWPFKLHLSSARFPPDSDDSDPSHRTDPAKITAGNERQNVPFHACSTKRRPAGGNKKKTGLTYRIVS